MNTKEETTLAEQNEQAQHGYEQLPTSLLVLPHRLMYIVHTICEGCVRSPLHKWTVVLSFPKELSYVQDRR